MEIQDSQNGGDKRIYTLKGIPVTASNDLPHWIVRNSSLSKDTNYLQLSMGQNG